MNPKQQRLELIKQIVEKDPARYGYLIYQPFITNISTNYKQYPNEFIIAIRDSIAQFAEYHNEVLSDDQAWGNKYKEFCNNYIKSYQSYLINQQQLQAYYAQLQQQQQYSQGGFGPQNQQYLNNQNYAGNQTLTPSQVPYTQSQSLNQNQHSYQNYNQNYQKQNFNQQQVGGQVTGQSTGQVTNTNTTHHQGGYNQSGHQNYRQNRNYQQGNNANYQGGTQNYQHNNYNAQQTNYQNNTGDQPTGHQQHRYQNNNQQNRPQRFNNNGQQANYNGQQPHYQSHYNNNGQQPHYNNRQYGHHNRHNQSLNNQYQPQQEQIVSPVVQQKPKVEEPVAPAQPIKHVAKAMKFSLLQIKEFIGSWSDKNKQVVSKDLIDKINQVNGWTKGQASFQEKPEKSQNNNKYDKNKNRQRDNRDNRGDRDQRGQKDGQQQGFNTGSKYNRAPQVPPELTKKDTGLKIVVGKNQTLQAKMIKKQIKEKAGQDFATLMQKQNQGLDKIQLTKKQIIYNLNLLAPQNISDIKKDLIQYLYNDNTQCHILIEQIIQKAWGQPKYASTYAKLCSQFSKYPTSDFKFETSKKEKKSKDNPFKVFLISKVQHSFDKKVEEIPQFKNDQQKDKFLTDTKKKILGNVKFIAELIRSKVLKKRIMKICISQLIFTFLSKYYYYRKTAKLIDSYYDYYFEAMIEFIENVGEFFEKMDEPKEKQEADTTSLYQPAYRKVLDLIEMNQKPPEQQISQINDLKADDYFKLFELIDQKVLKQKNTRLSALLLNLKERRSNNWAKHHSQADGPKKLKDLKQDIAKQEQEMNKIKIQKKQNMEHLHDLIKAMYKDWETDAKNQKNHFKAIFKQYTEVQFLTACLNQLADEKKENIRKRVDLFDVILENNFNLKILQSAWIECVKFMAFNSGDFPFCSAAVALVLKKILTKQPAKIKDFYYKTEDQDEQFFTNEVFGKLYHYTQWQEIKSLMTPSKKYTNMLEDKV